MKLQLSLLTAVVLLVSTSATNGADDEDDGDDQYSSCGPGTNLEAED